MIHAALMLSGTLVALLLAALLWAIAGLHAYWGRGGLWPEASAFALARRVVGAPGIETMPGESASYTVAALLFVAGLWPLMMIGLLPSPLPAELMIVGGYGLTAIFLVRGVAAYLPAFRAYFPEEPFATLDRRLYGPICLFIGLSFTYLLVLGWLTP
jgi:Protein of unknown function (DUF3995)